MTVVDTEWQVWGLRGPQVLGELACLDRCWSVLVPKARSESRPTESSQTKAHAPATLSCQMTVSSDSGRQAELGPDSPVRFPSPPHGPSGYMRVPKALLPSHRHSQAIDIY